MQLVTASAHLKPTLVVGVRVCVCVFNEQVQMMLFS